MKMLQFIIKNIFVISVTMITLSVKSQSLSPFVISTSGFYSEQENILFSCTTGEPVIETINNSISTLTQGFQQSNNKFILIENTERLLNFNVYPVPAKSILIVESNGTGQNYQLVSLQGMILKSGLIKMNRESIDISDIPEGLYIFKVNNATTHKIIKK